MTSPVPTPTTSPSLVSPSSPILAILSKQQTRLKLPSSPDFSGEQNSSQAFFNSSMLYLYLAPKQFSYNKEKIFWTLVFFKDWWATRWSENLFCQKVDTDIFPIQS